MTRQCGQGTFSRTPHLPDSPPTCYSPTSFYNFHLDLSTSGRSGCKCNDIYTKVDSQCPFYVWSSVTRVPSHICTHTAPCQRFVLPAPLCASPKYSSLNIILISQELEHVNSLKNNPSSTSFPPPPLTHNTFPRARLFFAVMTTANR